MRAKTEMKGPAKPLALKAGDTVGVVSLAAAVEQQSLERGLEMIRSIGFRASLAPHPRSR
jgi:muramoyltetrapeptide carboxypeptidase LdcA involved in peptidoglycan recycling